MSSSPFAAVGISAGPAIDWPRALERWARLAFAVAPQAGVGVPPPGLRPTWSAPVFGDGCAPGGATLLRFAAAPARFSSGPAVLLVPSLINRWYVLDLRDGASLVQHLVGAGLDVYAIDWGDCRDEDRDLEWDNVVARLARMRRAVARISGQRRIAVLGYCMGATLAAIEVALRPDGVSALIDLAGPIDFSRAGRLRESVQPDVFDADAVASAGNVAPAQMQAGFTALRPTQQLAKWVGVADRWDDDIAVASFAALEAWANDNVAFPAEAYRTYIRELYQQNRLVAGTHVVAGERVDLSRIVCPTLVITAGRDAICPPPAALVLIDRVGAADRRQLAVPGGHVGAVVGSRAVRDLYPAVARFIAEVAE